MLLQRQNKQESSLNMDVCKNKELDLKNFSKKFEKENSSTKSRLQE